MPTVQNYIKTLSKGAMAHLNGYVALHFYPRSAKNMIHFFHLWHVSRGLDLVYLRWRNQLLMRGILWGLCWQKHNSFYNPPKTIKILVSGGILNNWLNVELSRIHSVQTKERARRGIPHTPSAKIDTRRTIEQLSIVTTKSGFKIPQRKFWLDGTVAFLVAGWTRNENLGKYPVNKLYLKKDI